jgi:hypothetical protein
MSGPAVAFGWAATIYLSLKILGGLAVIALLAVLFGVV